MGKSPSQVSSYEEIYDQTFTQDLAPGEYVLRRVQDQIDLLHYLETVGLKIGTPFTFEGFDPFTQLYRLHIDGKDIQIPEAIASNLYIESN